MTKLRYGTHPDPDNGKIKQQIQKNGEQQVTVRLAFWSRNLAWLPLWTI